MTKENVTNFATTALVSPNPLTSTGTSFLVTGGQGALFPTSNFLVTIDSEIILIASRSFDTFTIGARGYDGTTAASHLAAATIQLNISAQHFNHLWQNVADTPNPLVPPAQIPGKSPSPWDNEFETLGPNWILYPPFGGGAPNTTWNVGGNIRSHLTFTPTDSGTYWAYVPFNPPAGSWMATTKLSAALNFNYPVNTNDQRLVSFVVSDSTNPTGGPGNYVAMDYVASVQTATPSAGIAPNYTPGYDSIVRMTRNPGPWPGLAVAVPFATPLHFRIYYDGNGSYTTLIGDGITFSTIGSIGSIFITPQTLYLQFWQSTSGGRVLGASYAVDYVRVLTNISNPSIGPGAGPGEGW